MITTGLALVCREQRDRLFTVRGHIHDALKTKGAATDPEATKLCAVLVHVEKAIEILQQQTGGEAQPHDALSPAGDSKL